MKEQDEYHNGGELSVDEATTEMERRLHQMFGDLQERSRTRAEKKYGPGPHRVAITIEVPPLAEIWGDDSVEDDDDTIEGSLDGDDDDDYDSDEDDDDSAMDDDCLFPEDEFFNDEEFGRGYGCQPKILAPNERSIILEMASLDFMPHSVLLFLDQVTSGLWDGCYFVRNAGHVLQATPKVDQSSPAISDAYSNIDRTINLTGRFVDADLMSVHFQEYSHSFPHQKYTVGFAGRPGGPAFYINKRDNTDAHGPGGQKHGYGRWDDAEPCFAKVVDGFEAVRWMAAIPVDEGNKEGLDRMRRYVRIKKATLME